MAKPSPACFAQNEHSHRLRTARRYKSVCQKKELMGIMRFVTDNVHVIDNPSELLVLLVSRSDPSSKLAMFCTRIWNRCNRLIQGLKLDDLECSFQPKLFHKF